MATKMGYAPGVRIQLKDNSAYTVVQNPNTVAGIVGYASKGELNKIINVANTGELGVKLGYGYQSYKYNQGMYAANAVLTTGGEVEFVRPYGEEISRTDAYKRDLKTDAFVVAFDKNAALYDDNKAVDQKTGELLTSTSLNVKHYASTRYKTDGAAEFGVTRKINNIAETIESNNNVQFNVDASENFADSKASRLYDNAHCTDMVMFAIMNRDPSYANRAYDRYEVIQTAKENQPAGYIQCTLSTKPVFVVGDTVYVPDTSKKQNQYGNGGSSAKTATALVTAIEDKVVTLKFDNDYALGINKPDVLIFNDPENAIADGFDYLNIKTAVAGNSVKNFASIKFGVEDKFPSEVLKTGALLLFRDKNDTEFYVRLNGGTTPFGAGTAAYDAENNQLTVTFTDTDFVPSNYIIEGETIDLNLTPSASATMEALRPFVVQSIKDNKLIGVKPADLEAADSYKFTEGYFDADQKADVIEADVTAIMSDSESDNWYYVAQQIANALQRYKGYSRVAFTNDIKSISDTKVTVDPSAAYDYAVGDIVAIVRNTNAVADADAAKKAAYDKETYTITGINPMSGVITLDAVVSMEIDADIAYQLINLTSTNATVYNADSTYKKNMTRTANCTNVVVATDTITGDGTTTYKSKIAVAAAEHADVDTVITLVKGGTTVTFTVAEINDGYLYTAEAASAPVPADTYTTGTYTYESLDTFDFADMYLASSYTLYVSKLDQGIATFGELSTDETIDTGFDFVDKANSVFNATVDKSPTVLADSDIGASFLALGLAKTRYVDVDFDGNPKQVFTLTDDGVAVARMFMAVRYRFNGKMYEFEGTVAPFNYNNRQLSIKEAADYELEDSGLEFVLNDSGVLDYFLENNSYDLSQTIIDGVLNGSYTAIAYNEDDPAIQYDGVWTYDPQNNNSGSTLATVWNLFVNKDASDVDMLVAAGMAINAPFTKKYETLNTQVMQAMINVCEARKDCFCVFDGVYEPDIQKAVKKMISAGQLSLGRWGAIYDGRGVFQDSLYTNSQVDVMKSVQLAAIITANRSSGIFWIPPAGDEAYVPAAWGTKERFTRSYNSEDKNCDHAKLSDIHVNATRVNKDGIRIWGDFTCQMEDTAFNQIHVTMLVAGIHKMFYKYLDHKVFKLNTTVLRAQITSDLQDKLNAIKRQNPPGLIEGKVICDDTNNTPEIIDQNFLIVDLRLLPPKSTRWIILRTTVESQKNGKTIATEVNEQ